jgi:hypothetical protein
MDLWNDTLERYGAGPERLESALIGLSDTDLNTGPRGGGWTIRQLVHHIVDGDDLWKNCVKAALGNSAGVFELYWYWSVAQDDWADYWYYDERPISPALSLFKLNREYVVDLLGRDLGTMAKTIHVSWPNEQEQVVSVEWLVEMQARHVEGHLEDIRKIREANDF